MIPKSLEALKNYFITLANKQSCIYEDDYHEACYDITDSKLIGDINTWLVASGIPMRKNKTPYSKKVTEMVKHPDVKKADIPLEKKASIKNQAGVSYHSTSKEDFERYLNGVTILDGGGWFTANDEKIHIAIAHSGGGYTPGGVIAADDMYRSSDEALQAAFEILMEYELNNHMDYLEELEQDRLKEWKKEHAQELVEGTITEEELKEKSSEEAFEWFQDDWDGMTWTLPAKEAAEVIKNSKYASEYISISPPEELEELEASQKKKATIHLTRALDELRDEDFDTEFLPPWKKKEAQFAEEQGKIYYIEDSDPGFSNVVFRKVKVEDKYETEGREKVNLRVLDGPDQGEVLQGVGLRELYTKEDLDELKYTIQKKRAQQIDNEKKQLTDAINSRQSQLPNKDQLLIKVQEANDVGQLKSIWEQVNSIGAAASQEEKDPVDEHIQAVAKEEFEGSLKREIKFDNGLVFTVDVADSPAQKVAGLEIMEKLSENQGMIFPFERPDHVTFHMGKVKFPIDIIFLMKDPMGMRVAKIIHNAQPGSSDIWSNGNTVSVLEIAGGLCKKHEIEIGSTCSLQETK